MVRCLTSYVYFISLFSVNVCFPSKECVCDADDDDSNHDDGGGNNGSKGGNHG